MTSRRSFVLYVSLSRSKLVDFSESAYRSADWYLMCLANISAKVWLTGLYGTCMGVPVVLGSGCEVVLVLGRIVKNEALRRESTLVTDWRKRIFRKIMSTYLNAGILVSVMLDFCV